MIRVSAPSPILIRLRSKILGILTPFWYNLASCLNNRYYKDNTSYQRQRNNLLMTFHIAEQAWVGDIKMDKATKWDKGEFSKREKVSPEDKKAIAEYYQAGLKTGKSSKELWEELAKRYDRHIRQIQRYISQVKKQSLIADAEAQPSVAPLPLDVAQRKQLSEFLATLSLPSAFLIRSEDFYDFVKGDLEAMLLKLNRGMLCLDYAPPYVRHHLFSQAKEILAGDAMWGELDGFVGGFNTLLADCSDLWHDIYNDAKEALDAAETKFPTAGVTRPVTALGKMVHKDGQLLSSSVESISLSASLDFPWYRFVPLIYEDAVGWSLGKNLTPVRKEDYDYGHSGDKQFVVRYQVKASLLEFKHKDESMGFQLAAFVRDKHIELRQKYREREEVKKLAEAMHRLEIQRGTILTNLRQLAASLGSPL